MTANFNPNRRFLYEVLVSGLDLQTITPDDVILHATPEVLAHHLPIALKAKLLQASLSAERMTPSLIVEVVGVEALVEHTPLSILWACVRVCAARHLQGEVDDAPVPSLSAPATAATPASGNGGGVVAGTIPGTDDLQLKPPKVARPTLRPSSSSSPRVSSLSPRSQVLRRSVDAVAGQIPNGAFDRSDEPPDFEIVEESEVPARARSVNRGGEVDDDTRPGNGKP